MSPVSYDPKSGVQGPAAALTMVGLALALVLAIYRPMYGLIAGAVGAVVGAVIFVTKAQGNLGLVARLGLGLAVGAALAYGLDAIGVLPKVAP